MTIPLAHDFVCPWCWIAFLQAKRMRSEFGVDIEWRSYELHPAGLPRREKANPDVRPEAPPIPGRIELALAAEGTELPAIARPKEIDAHPALEVTELAKERGVADEVVERIYRAYWEHGLDISQPSVLVVLCAGQLPAEEVLAVIEERRFQQRIIGFDDPSYATGVYHVPTFWIGGERYAEQPYVVLRRALMQSTQLSEDQAASPYRNLEFPTSSATRPYTFINMVATIDGKTISGERDQNVMDLGSKTDHATMRRLESAADAVLIGAGTLRATMGLWYPKDKTRIVASNSGNLDLGSRFFADAPEKAIVVTTNPKLEIGEGIRLLYRPTWPDILEALRSDGIRTLLVEGGSELNAQLLELDLVDELFLTIAPKVKLGRETPTYAGGTPLPRERLPHFRLVEQHAVCDEVFLRYRRNR